MNAIKHHTISFKNASSGLLWAFKTQPNYRAHILLSLIALLGGWYLGVSYAEFLVIIVFVTVGLAIETINTSIEQTTDAIDREHREDIRIAKDVSAAAMLIFAIGAFITALVIFVPKLQALLYQ